VTAVAAFATSAQGEIYRWVDADGRVHYTADLSQVPRSQRRAAESAAETPPGQGRVQTFETPTSGLRRSGPGPASPGPSGAAKTYRIRVERAGNSLLVPVRINDQVTAPFVIDTGASHVVVPRAVIDKLGVDLSGARTAQYSTANGTITSQLIQLDSVELAGARVQDVPAAVSDAIPVGLLGLSFFNRFQYQVDPAQGIVTLTPNGLEEQGLIRGGRSEADWRSQYGQIRARMERIEQRREEVPRSHSRAHDELDEQQAELERQLRTLDREADAARVPFSWRE